MWRSIPALAVLLTASVVHAQGTSPQVGQRVVIKYKHPLKIGEVVIEPKEYRAYTVEGTDGDWLWLVSGGVSGWIPKGAVVPLDQAVNFYTQEIIKNPDSWNAYLYRGFVWDVKHEYDNAIADYTRSIRIYPSWANTFNNRGWSWHCKKEYDKAIADYNEAVRLEPKCVLAIVNRGLAWQDKKDYYKALDDFRLAIKVDPKYARAYVTRAWLFATCPDKKFRDGNLAVESATRACELTMWRDGNKLAVLAAGYAESGDFQKAIRWQQESIHRSIDPEDKERGRERLELYKRKQPFRVADGHDPDREQGDGAGDSPEKNRWSRFPDPELARRVFAELEERIGKPIDGANGRDRKPSQAKVSSIVEIVARKHHLKQSEVRAIWRAGDSTGKADLP